MPEIRYKFKWYIIGGIGYETFSCETHRNPIPPRLERDWTEGGFKTSRL